MPKRKQILPRDLMRPLAGTKTFRKSGQTISSPWRVLVIDQDVLPPRLIDSLAAAGFSLERRDDIQQAFSELRPARFDLVLIDFDSGINASNNIRAYFPDAGVILLRSDGTPEDEFLALDGGADDCIHGPFRFREMVARMGAVLRRNQAETCDRDVLRSGAIELDAKQHVCRRSGQNIHLSRLEFNLLHFFMRHPGVPLTHVRLLRGAWAERSSCDLEMLRLYIGFLRKKLENDPTRPSYIMTERWVGYTFQVR